MLDGIGTGDVPPEAARAKHGAFSVVVDRGRDRVRRLPSLYVNDLQLYADRDVERVRGVLERAVDAFVHSAERATYMLTACEARDRRGLYGADSFNRTRLRLELRRLGMRFSDDPFVVLREDGWFESTDTPAFDPDFLVFPDPAEGSAASIRPSGAALVHRFAWYRIADLDAAELRRLPARLSAIEVIGAAGARDLAAAVVS